MVQVFEIYGKLKGVNVGFVPWDEIHESKDDLPRKTSASQRCLCEDDGTVPLSVSSEYSSIGLSMQFWHPFAIDRREKSFSFH